MNRIYVQNVRSIIEIGHQGEHLSRCVCFDLSELKETFGEGRFEIAVKRPTESLIYLASEIDEIGEYAVWKLTSSDTAIAGFGRCEMRYYVDDILCKTDVYTTRLFPSLSAEPGPAPDPYDDKIEKLSELAVKAKDEADRAAASEEAAALSARAAEDSALNASASSSDALRYASASETSAEEAKDYRDEAKKILESMPYIPEDYTQLSKDVETLKGQIGTLKFKVSETGILQVEY